MVCLMGETDASSRSRPRNPLKILAAATFPSGSVNEDAIGYTSDCAWVIDGATGVGENRLPGPSDAAWFAETISAALRALLPQHPDLSTKAVLGMAVNHAADRLDRDAVREAAGRHEQPSAAIAIARVRPDGLELTTLGDCQIVYRDASGRARLFGDSDIAPFEKRTLALAAGLLQSDPALTPSALRAALLPQLQENRGFMNVPGGYWVLSTDPAALDHLQQTILPAGAGPVCLASDGFLRLHDLFQVMSLDDILAIRSDSGAMESLTRLRRLELEDPECRAYVRIKPSDDASLISVDFSGGVA
jgi:hypothetical protein